MIPRPRAARDLTPAQRLALHDGAATFRERDLPRLMRAGPETPFGLLLRWPVQSLAYDRNRGGYALRQEGFNERLGTLWGTPLDTVTPLLWPISEADAAELERARGGKPAAYYFAMPLTITGISLPASGAPDDEDTGLPRGAAWQFSEGAISIYADEALTRRLYTFGPEAPRVAASTNGPDAVANGMASAAQWKLRTLLGLPAASDGRLTSE